MPNKLVSFPTEVFGGLLGKASKALKDKKKKTEERMKKIKKGK